MADGFPIGAELERVDFEPEDGDGSYSLAIFRVPNAPDIRWRAGWYSIKPLDEQENDK